MMETTIAYTIAPAYVAAPVILGIDASSTNLGWVILDGPTVRDYGELQLRHSDIAERCRLAYAGIGLVLANHPDVDAVAIESPVLRRFKDKRGKFQVTTSAIIPQCYVQGAIRCLLSQKQIPICDVAPAEAKKALTQYGGAKKQGMGSAALGYGVSGEHASDALGVALHASQMVIKEAV